MEAKIYNNHSDKLILVFADWGMDETAFPNLSCTTFDLMICFNYTTLDFHNKFSKYREINIVAWGAGVWAASAAFDRHYRNLKLSGKLSIVRLLKKLGRCVAVNGTLCPVSNTWGVSEEQFAIMLESLKEGSGSNIPRTRAAEDMLNELASIRENFVFCNAVLWNRIIIGKNDILIPVEKQREFWNDFQMSLNPDNKLAFNAKDFCISTINAGHNPFSIWKSWEEIIE